LVQAVISLVTPIFTHICKVISARAMGTLRRGYVEVSGQLHTPAALPPSIELPVPMQ